MTGSYPDVHTTPSMQGWAFNLPSARCLLSVAWLAYHQVPLPTARTISVRICAGDPSREPTSILSGRCIKLVKHSSIPGFRAEFLLYPVGSFVFTPLLQCSVHREMPAIEVELPMGDAFSHYSGRIKTNSQNYKPPFLSSTCSPSRRAGRSHGWPPSLSPTAHRSEAIERAVCISPFRSVRQMKEPFQLKLPVSPSHEGHRSSMGLARQSSGNKGQPRTLSSPIEFKPKRPCVSSQDLSSSTLKTIGLLPSPSFSEPCKRPEPGYSGMSQCDEIKQSNPLNEEFGVALTSSPPRHAEQDRPQLESESVKAHDMERMASTAESQFPPHMNSFEVQSSSFPIEHKTRDRTGTTSSAASWAPSNLKKCESWLQGVPTETSELEDEKTREMNRRKIQIIQQEEEYREEWSSPPVLRTPNQSPKQGRKPVRLRIDTEAANQSIVRTSAAIPH